MAKLMSRCEEERVLPVRNEQQSYREQGTAQVFSGEESLLILLSLLHVLKSFSRAMIESLV